MDLVLRLMQPRYAAAVVAAALAVGVLLRWSGYLYERANFMLHPPAPAAGQSTLAAALGEQAERRESARLRGLHRAVSSEIQARRGVPGFDADELQKSADAALLLDKPRYRGAAVERLNKIRLAVPLPRENIRTAGGGEAPPPAAKRAEAPEPKAVPGMPIGRYPKKGKRR